MAFGFNNKRRVIRRIPPIYIRKGAGGLYINWNATYRSLFYGLKARLEAVKGGCDVDNEFQADIVVQASGQHATIGQIIVDGMSSGRITPSTDQQVRNFLALPSNELVETNF